MIIFGICSMINGISVLMEARSLSPLRTMLFGAGSAQLAFGLVGVCMIAAGVLAILNSITKQQKYAVVSRVLLLTSTVACVLCGHAVLREMIGVCLLYSVYILRNHKRTAKT